MSGKAKLWTVSMIFLFALASYIMGYCMFKEHHAISGSNDGSGRRVTGIHATFGNAALTALFYPAIKADLFLNRHTTIWIWGDGEMSFL